MYMYSCVQVRGVCTYMYVCVHVCGGCVYVCVYVRKYRVCVAHVWVCMGVHGMHVRRSVVSLGVLPHSALFLGTGMLTFTWILPTNPRDPLVHAFPWLV